MLIQGLNRIVSRPKFNVKPGQILNCTTNCIPINLMLKENFPTNTQVWNTLSHHMTADREEWSELPMGATTETRTRSGTSVFRRSSVPPRAWVGPTTNWSQPDTVVKSKATTPWRFVVVEPNHSWWWPFKSPTNRKEARTSSAGTAAIDVSQQSKFRSWGQGCSKDWAHIKFCLASQTLKTSISQQPHSNLGWWNNPYPSSTYAAFPRAPA